MPTYEYECIHCGHRFELKQGFHDKPHADCPQCKNKAKRIFHPSPIIFKGSGFYVTDNRKGSDRSTSRNAPESGKPKQESAKSESGTGKGESGSGQQKQESAKAKSETKKNTE